MPTHPCFIRIAALLLIAIPCSAPKLHAAEKSPAQVAWEKLVGEKALENPAFAYVEDDPALPRVLIIGDSISIGYTAPVRELLAGKANLHRIPVNGGDTRRGLDQLNTWLGKGVWDVIHFNWGLHDLKRMKDGNLDASMEREVAPEDYQRNLRELAQRLQKTGAKLIWGATTPVPEGSQGRIPGDEVTYNALAAEVMKELDIPVNDLHACVLSDLPKWQREANVHFTPEGSAHLGGHVADHILQALAE